MHDQQMCLWTNHPLKDQYGNVSNHHPLKQNIIMSIRNVAILLVFQRMICLHKHICWTSMTLLLATHRLDPIWTSGTIIKELSPAETLNGLHKTQWAWRNNRSDLCDPTTGVKTTYLVCQGVWHCINDDCHWTLRPNIRSQDLKNRRVLTYSFNTYLVGSRCGRLFESFSYVLDLIIE